jgi:hypothetical protein
MLSSETDYKHRPAVVNMVFLLEDVAVLCSNHILVWSTPAVIASGPV